MTEPSRLIARFILRKSGKNHKGRISLPAGDYRTETRVVGEDLEILMWLKEKDIRV